MPKLSDPLCPLGFHPQVRWPTRCKRCFREYKDHVSNSLVPVAGTSSQSRSTDKLAPIGEKPAAQPPPSASVVAPSGNGEGKGATPQIAQQELNATTPEKPPRASHSTEHQKDYSSIYSSLSGPALARISKYRAAGASTTQKPGSPVSASSRPEAREKSTKDDANESERRGVVLPDSNYSTPDVDFILEVKRSSSGKGARSSDESTSIAGTDFTETTDTTLVDANNQDLQDQINGLRRDVEKYRQRCERLERENEELTNKRYRPGVMGGTGSETARMQLRIRELETNNEDLLDEKRSSELRIAELERELESRPSVAHTIKTMEELRAKSAAAEALIEELMEENEELKKDMRVMVEEMDELQDSFREDQVDEYRDLKKDLDQTAKNCRILQFKLRKSERRVEHLENEKRDLESKLSPPSDGPAANQSDQVRKLELELSNVREQLARSQQEVQKMQTQPRVNKELPTAGPVLSKSRSLEGTVTTSPRAAPEDLTQAQRDLQDCLEREADLREQLRFAEEESESFRKKLSRIEEENESLMMQLKKMTSKRGRRTNSEDTAGADDKKEGDPEQQINDLRLQVELNEQETVVLRRKVEELESENDRLTKEVTRLQEQAKQGPGSPSDSMEGLRTQLMEKDKEIQHLNEALTQAEKNKGKVVFQRSRSLEGESALDLKRQLQLVEQEAAILRTKTAALETEHEKLVAENRKLQLRASRKPPPTDSEKLLIDKMELEERLKALEKKLTESAKQNEPDKSRPGRPSDRNGRVTAPSAESTVLKREKEILERENKAKEQQIGEMNHKIQNLEKEKDNLHHRLDNLLMPVDRTPKKPTETMTKQQLKKMVEDLENEATHLVGKINAMTATQTGTSPQKLEEIMRSLREEREKREKLESEKKNLEEKLKSGHHGTSESLDFLRKKIDELEKKNNDMAAKMKTGDFVDFDTLHQVKQEKHKLQKELAEKDGKLSEADKKLKESEDKSKKLDRSLKEVKDRVEDLERQLEEEKNRHRQSESSYKELSVNWLKERDDLKKQITDYRSKVEELDTNLSAKDKKIKDLENNLKDELKKATDVSARKLERELNNAKEELQTFKGKAEDLEQKLVRSDMERKSLNEKISRMETDWRKERDQLIARATDLEVEIKSDKKKRDRAEKEYEQELRDKDEEIIGYKERIKRLDLELKAALEKFEDLKNQDTRSRELEIQLEREHQDYEDLTAKYDMLEEDYLVIKAKLVLEKESIQREYLSLKKEYDTIENELRALRETFNLRQDTWIKEKLDMQERVKELEEKQSRSASDNLSIESNRLKRIIEEKNQQIEKMKKDNEGHVNHFDSVRKENEDLRRKLEDFDKVTKVQRSFTFDSSEHDRIISDLKNKLSQVEKNHRTEMAQAKMRADNKLALLQEEANVAHMQLEKARRERDTFREMLDGAQRIIAELKSEHHDKHGIKATAHEMEENLARIEELHARIMSLEDELNEARAEASRVKTELINEKSARDVKFLELQTRINELEEEKIMSMGRSRITGVRTRIELAWQKEREEQQRMIQETSTLAKDLRQTLLEVEKERERERLESRRRMEQQKRASEEEQVEIRKKITELQSDLLELRDAHAKLRTSCEKLRRDKERVERERDEANRSATEARKFDSDSDRRLQLLTSAIEKVKDLSPFMFGDSLADAPTITKKDRDTRNERAKEEFMSSLRQICNIGDEWKNMRQRDDDPVKRGTLSKRAMSTTVDDKSSQNGSNTLKSTAPSYTKRSQPTYRRSLSLEQSQNINEANSGYDLNTSLNDEPVYVYRSRTVDRDPSLDRLSTDSTSSEPAFAATPETKKKKGLIGKIKQMARSKSIEDSITAASLVSAGMQALVPSVSVDSDSELSLDVAVEKKKEKKSVKDKLTGVFRRSSSRANSMERSDSIEEAPSVSSSAERPLQRVGGRSTPTPTVSRASYTSSNTSGLRSQRSVETDV